MDVQALMQNNVIRIGALVLGTLLALNLLLIIVNLVIRRNKDGVFGMQKAAVNYVKSVSTELKQVEWLSGKNTIRYTIIVIIASIVFGGFIALLDYLFFNLRGIII